MGVQDHPPDPGLPHSWPAAPPRTVISRYIFLPGFMSVPLSMYLRSGSHFNGAELLQHFQAASFTDRGHPYRYIPSMRRATAGERCALALFYPCRVGPRKVYRGLERACRS
jgi:hypothetical protein